MIEIIEKSSIFYRRVIKCGNNSETTPVTSIPTISKEPTVAIAGRAAWLWQSIPCARPSIWWKQFTDLSEYILRWPSLCFSSKYFPSSYSLNLMAAIAQLQYLTPVLNTLALHHHVYLDLGKLAAKPLKMVIASRALTSHLARQYHHTWDSSPGDGAGHCYSNDWIFIIEYLFIHALYTWLWPGIFVLSRP